MARFPFFSVLISFVALGPVLNRPASAQSPHPALEYGTPDTGHLIDYGSFAISYDGRLRSARWAAEKLTKESLKKNAERANKFRADERIDPEFRAELYDYKYSGFDRGHLAPSADHLLSVLVNRQTFFLTNMSPQVGSGFNQHYWARLEASIRRLALTEEVKSVFVFTGPLFMPAEAPEQGDAPDNRSEASERLSLTITLIGPNHVPVPTHYFKALLVEPSDPDSVTKLYTLVLPNKRIDGDTPLTRFVRSVDYLEHWAGFDLWAELPDAAETFKESTTWSPWAPLAR